MGVAVVRNMEEAVLFFTQEAVESAYQVAHSVRAHWGNVGHSYLSDTDAVDSC